MLIFLQICCSILFATGVLFAIVDLRTRFDSGIRYFGISLIMLSMMGAIDIWLFPEVLPIEEKLYWQRITHILGCGFGMFSLVYLSAITKFPNPLIYRVGITIGLITSLATFSNHMFTVEGGKIVGGVFYPILFFPTALYYVVSTNIIIYRSFRYSLSNERKILGFHLFGLIILCIGGVMDMTGFINPAARLIPSFKLVGILVYGFMAAMIFAERFFLILKEKEETFQKLQSAYRDMEQVSALHQLGESTAIINHEIKNYTFMISGNISLLKDFEKLSPKGEKMVANLIHMVTRLQNFSKDILELSRSQIQREKRKLNVSELLIDCVNRHFSSRTGITFYYPLEEKILLHGDWDRLQQVFINIIQNSLEAAVPGRKHEVKIKLRTARHYTLISIEDNGKGCKKEDLENLFKAFYTTKKGRGHSGLGLSTVRAVVESHGGRISAYSKNASDENSGMIFNLSFPSFGKDEESKPFEHKDPVVLVLHKMSGLGRVLRIFQNVGVNPRVVKDFHEPELENYLEQNFPVIVDPKGLEEQTDKLLSYDKLTLISELEGVIHAMLNTHPRRPEVFDEQFVLSFLNHHGEPQATSRNEHKSVPESGVENSTGKNEYQLKSVPNSVEPPNS